jgi:hypothetical protein
VPIHPTTDFTASARRHVDDAGFLHGSARLTNADHLAGLAAECGLKALIEGYLGGKRNPKDLITDPRSGKPMMHHVDTLWPEVALIIQSRPAKSLVQLLANQPFADWKVSERYCDGSHLTGAVVLDHLNAARKVVSILEQAIIDGALK